MQTISISKWVAAAVNPLVHGDLLNPNGIPSLSPGLRGTNYPGWVRPTGHTPERVASPRAGQRCNPVGVENDLATAPRVGARRAGLNDDAMPLGLRIGFFVAAFLLFTTLAGFAQINLSIGNLGPGESVTLTFDVTLTNPFPAGVTAVTNQGTLSGSNFTPVYSDDPQTAPSGDATVTVVDVPPTVLTLAASPIGLTNATLNGSVNPNSLATAAWFQFGLTTNYGSVTATNSIGAGSAGVPISALLTGLSQGTLYHFRAVATNGAGLTAGNDLFFTTIAVAPPQLTSLNISNGVLRFRFTNSSGLGFSVFAATNVTLPFSNWTAAGSSVEGPSGVYQFTDLQSVTNKQRYYRVRWP
jgi:hypothetical protein